MSGGGDTPLGKRWRYNIGGTSYCAGTISEGEPDKLIADIVGGTFQGVQSAAVINEDGNVVGPLQIGDSLWNLIKTAIENAYNCQIADKGIMLKPLTFNDPVPDWETYELIS